MTAALTVTLVNRLTEIERLSGLVDGFCTAHGLGPDVAFAVNLALDEVITNVVSYAYADAREHHIEVRISLDGGVLRTEVHDDGQAFNPLEVSPPDLDAPVEERRIGGLGLHLVRQMMDTLEYRREDDRNVLAMTRRLP